MNKVFFIAIFLIILLFFLRSDFFSIRNVAISGEKNDCWDEEKIKQSIGLIGQNIFLIDTEKVAKEIGDKFICIKSVSLSRTLPKNVRINISPRKPAASLVILLNNQDSLKSKEATASNLLENLATPSALDFKDQYIIDSEGVIFSKNSGENIQKIYLEGEISLGGKVEKDLLSKVLKIIEKIKVFGVEMKDTLLRDDFFLINPYSNNPRIIFRLSNSLDVQLASLQLILGKAKIDGSRLEFIDLRFDKPVLKFTPKESNGKR